MNKQIHKQTKQNVSPFIFLRPKIALPEVVLFCFPIEMQIFLEKGELIRYSFLGMNAFMKPFPEPVSESEGREREER